MHKVGLHQMALSLMYFELHRPFQVFSITSFVVVGLLIKWHTPEFQFIKTLGSGKQNYSTYGNVL